MARRRRSGWGIVGRLAPGLALAVGAAGFLWSVGPETAGAAVVGGTGTILHDVTDGTTVTVSGFGGEGIKVGTFVDTDGSTTTELTVQIEWGDGSRSAADYLTCTYGSRHGVSGLWCTVFGSHGYEGGGTHQISMVVTDYDESGYALIEGGAGASATTTAPGTPCIPRTHACQSRTAQPGESVTVMSGGVKVRTLGRGTVAVGTYGLDPAVPLPGSTGKYFAVQLSSSNGFSSLVVKDCSLAGGSMLEWWNGTSWAHVVGPTTMSSGCLSVTLGATSSPSLATIAKLSRLTRFQAVVFGLAR